MPQTIVSPAQAESEPKAPFVDSDSGVFIPTKLARIPVLAEMYEGALTEDQLRSWIFRSTWTMSEPFTSLRDCVIRIGRVVIVDVKMFDAWLTKYRGHVDLAMRGKLGGRPPKKATKKGARRDASR